MCACGGLHEINNILSCAVNGETHTKNDFNTYNIIKFSSFFLSRFQYNRLGLVQKNFI